MFSVIYFLVLLTSHAVIAEEGEFCDANEVGKPCHSSPSHKFKRKRYLLYDVNPGEGFNLRRDVYMRVSTLIKKLNQHNKTTEWTLVLPPWGPLYHWKTKGIGYQTQIKWEHFFDVPSLEKYVPVLEFEDFFNEHGGSIDTLFYLQHYAEGWTDANWEEKCDIKECNDPNPYSKWNGGRFKGWFWGYQEVYAKDFHCVSVQGHSSTLKTLLENSPSSVIMVDRAEIVLHDSFGDAEYWMVRRSMVFSKKLIAIGDKFRELYLNSTDKLDKTELQSSLTGPIKRKALGGPYVAVHLRRLDFVQARPKDVPTIAFASAQILKQMERLKLQKLFVATDASDSEFKEIERYIPGAVRFVPSKEDFKNILDGGVAIVDQWICAHARYFLGTHESTFSFRIQEEREILGFPTNSTFNRLCGDDQWTCTPPSIWAIPAN